MVVVSKTVSYNGSETIAVALGSETRTVMQKTLYENPKDVLTRLEKEFPNKTLKEIFVLALRHNDKTKSFSTAVESLKDTKLSDILRLLCDENGNFKDKEEAFATHLLLLENTTEFGNNIPVFSQKIDPLKIVEVKRKNIIYDNKISISSMLMEYNKVVELLVGKNPYVWMENALSGKDELTLNNVSAVEIIKHNKLSHFLTKFRNIFKSGVKNSVQVDILGKDFRPSFSHYSLEYKLLMNSNKINLNFYQYNYNQYGEQMFECNLKLKDCIFRFNAVINNVDLEQGNHLAFVKSARKNIRFNYSPEARVAKKCLDHIIVVEKEEFLQRKHQSELKRNKNKRAFALVISSGQKELE